MGKARRQGQSRREMQYRKEMARTIIRTDAFTKISRDLIKYGSLIACVYLVADAMKEFAGKESVAEMTFAMLANQPVAWALAAIFGGGGIIYGRKQSKLRKDTVEQLHRYQQRYELARDPGRSSSELTPRGDTPEEDA